MQNPNYRNAKTVTLRRKIRADPKRNPRLDSPATPRLNAAPEPILGHKASRARARSSAGEHTLHTGGVVGSIPTAPTRDKAVVNGG